MSDMSAPELQLFRVSSFQKLGFSESDSEKLSDVKVKKIVNTRNGSKIYEEYLSWHKVKKMLSDGCSHELALRILI
jgi:hypothetical protein